MTFKSDSTATYKFWGGDEPTIAEEIIRYWDEWVDSCGADSIVRKGVVRVYGTPCYNKHGCRINTSYIGVEAELCRREDHQHKVFGHTKDPNDLKGFMEFIKRRTK